MNGLMTLKKLASMLNLSVATVSRALKDHPDISDQTKKRVKELAELMDYEPNAYAISLKTNNSKEVGIIVPEISNYFYHSFIASVEEEARRYGYSVIILQSGGDPAIELENIKRCKKSRVSGLFVSVCSETSNTEEFKKIESNGIPLVFFDKVPQREAFNKVCVADVEAVEIAAAALIEKKKKRVLALFGSDTMSISKVRRDAFLSYYKKKAPRVSLQIEEAKSPHEAYEITLEAMKKKERPDAVFCMSDEILTGVMKAMQKLKVKIPEDIGIVAISNGFITQLYSPEITYAETSGFKLGKLAYARMMSCMAGSYFVQSIKGETLLIKGGSL